MPEPAVEPTSRLGAATAIATAAAVLAPVVGIVVLTGWAFDIEALKTVVGNISMKANMAIGPPLNAAGAGLTTNSP